MLTLVLALSIAVPAPPLVASELSLVGARVLAPEGDRWLVDRAVVVEDGRIVAIVPSQEARGESVDLAELYLVPGLIDLHSHLLLHPYDETSWNDQVLKESLELRTIRATQHARATLGAGWTTLRELGTEGAAYADVALRDATASWMIRGPRIYAATRALVATGCYGPAGFDPRWDMPIGAQVADGPVELRRAVREQVAAGADWIKVYADYRRRPGNPSTPTFSAAELEAIVDEATSAGLPVASHAVTAEAIRRSVLAGVRTIEHGYEANEEVLALMAERGVVLCPTLAANEAMCRYRGWQPGEPEPQRLANGRALIARALAAGATIACGSDVGVFPHGDNARELELLVDYGLSPAAALATATHIAAEVLGEGERLGRIEVGFTADLIAVREDPLADPSALREVAIVVQAGRVVVDRRAR